MYFILCQKCNRAFFISSEKYESETKHEIIGGIRGISQYTILTRKCFPDLPVIYQTVPQRLKQIKI